jgi:hypothetical protein
VLIVVEVIDAPLDYNILLDHNFMYAMKVVSSSVFHTMSFPHKGKIVTIDQLTYHDPKTQLYHDKVVSSLDGRQLVTSLLDINPRFYKDSTLH